MSHVLATKIAPAVLIGRINEPIHSSLNSYSFVKSLFEMGHVLELVLRSGLSTIEFTRNGT